MKRLYWTNPEDFEVEVNVMPINDNDVNIFPIIFHPDEGGQPSDKGFIGDAIVETVKVINGNICITLNKNLIEGKYIAKLDITHRQDMSSQHTAQHIISAIFETKYKNSTHGFHISEIHCTIDLKNQITWDQLEEIEVLANSFVMQNIPVDTIFDKTDNLRIREDLTKEQFEVLRIVKIGDLDSSACCGTHTTNTGKVGPIIIMGLETHKGGSRITYIAGQRAVKFIQKNNKIIRELKYICTSSIEELPSIVTKFSNQISSGNKKIALLWEKVLPQEIETAHIIEKNNEKYGILLTTAPIKLHNKLSYTLSEKTNGTSIVIENSDSPQLTISSKTLKAKELITVFFDKIGGKGGGSPQSASCKLTRKVTSEEIIELL